MLSALGHGLLKGEGWALWILLVDQQDAALVFAALLLLVLPPLLASSRSFGAGLAPSTLLGGIAVRSFVRILEMSLPGYIAICKL